jgi:hypothetical protein
MRRDSRDGLSRTAPDDFFYGPPVNKYGFTFSKGGPRKHKHSLLLRIKQCARIRYLRRSTLGRVPPRNDNNLEGPGASA